LEGGRLSDGIIGMWSGETVVKGRKALRSPYTRKCTVGCAGLAIMLLYFLACWAASVGRGNYMGWKNCASCHDKIAAEWQSSSHGQAFESLEKSSQQNLPACTPCHVTGYEQPGGFIDIELTPNLVGVQCEECHGPGGRHAAAPSKTTIVAKPGVETCRRCHTSGQDPNFDYQKKVRNIHSATGSSAKVVKQAVLSASPQHFDFGVVDEGVPATTVIVLQNLGDKPISITGMRTN
jgi:hypothetical protein